MANFVQSSFLGGEWSQGMQGRIDRPDYRTAMNVCLNGVLTEQGEWTRRPGFGYAAHTRGGVSGRLIKWPFQQNAPYTLEFTDGHIRFYADNTLATTNDQLVVSAISTANPAVATVPSNTWATGDQGMFNTLGTVDPLLLNRQFIFTVVDSTHLSLADAITGATIDGSTLATFTTGNLTRIADLVTPYVGGVWSSLRVVQAETEAVLLQGSVPPQLLTAVPPVGSASATFSITPASFSDGPYLDPVVGASLTPASVFGIVGFKVLSPTWSSTTAYNVGDYVVYSNICYQSLIPTNLGNEPDTATFAWAVIAQDKVFSSSGLQTSDIGRHIRLLSEPAAWASGTTYAAGNSIKYNNSYWTSVVGSNTGNEPGLDLSTWAVNANAATWTWGVITSLTGAVATQVSTANFSTIESSAWVGASAVFDGSTNKSSTHCAQITGINRPLEEWIGGNFTAETNQNVSYALVYAANNSAFVSWQSGSGTLTFSLKGSNTAPTGDGSGGTLLGTATAQNFSGATVQIFSNDTSTKYIYLWVEMTTSAYVGSVCVAQIQWFTTSSFSGTGISAQIQGPPLVSTNPIVTWQLGLFTAATGYPTCGTYHEGRLWIGGVISNRFDASALIDIYGNPTSTFFNFCPTSATGTVSDGNAINYTLDGPDVNPIFWMQPDQQGLIFETQAGEWLAQATTLNSPLSALNMQAHRVTVIGGANILPCRTEHTIVFAQRYQRKLMEYFADIFSGKFSAPNIAMAAEHLTSRTIMEIAYQQNISPTIWARCADDSLIGCAYKRDTLMSSQGPTYAGWHRHTHGAGRTIVSIADGPSPDGTLDTLAAVTTDGTYYHVEFMNPIFQETDANTTACFLDGFITPVVTQNVTVGGKSGMQCAGLWHLNGLTATVFAGGLDCGDWPVANGVLNVPYGEDPAGLFTAAFAAGFSPLPVIVGSTYTSNGQIVRPNTQQEAMTSSGPAFGRMGRIAEFAVLLNSTQGISFGTDFSKLDPAAFTDAAGNPFAANLLFSGVYWSNSIQDDSSRDGSKLCWQISRPYPATVVAISGVFQAQG